jgi:2-hydroxychromene-2-carboxylate isomerase
LATIEYFFSTVSPFTYLAGRRLEAIAARQGAAVTYRPLDIMQLFARTGGVPPAQRHESRRAYRLQELRRQAAKAGVPITLQPAFWPVNPAPSSYAVIAAARAGGDVGGLAHAFTRAVWAEERDIADPDTIRAILTEQGFDPGLADRGLFSSAETYERNLDDAVTRGVFGAPFYIVGDERFWGQDRLDDLDLHLAGQL